MPIKSYFENTDWERINIDNAFISAKDEFGNEHIYPLQDIKEVDSFDKIEE